MEFLKNKCSYELSQFIIDNGYLQSKVENNKITFYIQTYNKK